MMSTSDMYKYFELQAQNQDLTNRVALLEQALKFYANEPPTDSDKGPWGKNSTDFGRVAREALAGFRRRLDYY